MKKASLSLILIVTLCSVIAFLSPVEGQVEFSLSVAPSSLTVFPGQSATYTITVASIGGWSGEVQLSVTGSPPLPPGYFFTPPTVRVPARGQVVSTLSIPTDSSSKPLYELTITGTGGTIVRVARTQLIVTSGTTSTPTTPVPPPNIFLQLAPEWVWISLTVIVAIVAASWILFRVRSAAQAK
jgi:hypothetical protein